MMETDDLRTMVVPVELPRAILTPFLAAQQRREKRGLEWRTLEQWLQDKILAEAMVEYQAVKPRRRKRRTR